MPSYKQIFFSHSFAFLLSLPLIPSLQSASMSKPSLITSTSTPSIAVPSLHFDDVQGLPSAIVAPPRLCHTASLTEVNKVQLQMTNVVYHTEIWYGPHLPQTMQYENLDTLEILNLPIAPLARAVQISNADGSTRIEYKVVVPPLDAHNAQRKTLIGADPQFSGDLYRITHHHFQSADVWASSFLASPNHSLFQVHRLQNSCRLQHGSVLKAPIAWHGGAVVTEKLGELQGWTLLELRLRTSRQTIYVRVLSEYVAMDRTWYGQLGRWIRIAARRMCRKYNDDMHAR